MSANNSSVCVNGFTPLQLSVEYSLFNWTYKYL